MSTNIELYTCLCKNESSIPLFSQAWWLDATAGPGNWDVALVRKDDDIVASLPYMVKKQYGFTILSQPALTQTLGPWLRDSGGKSSKRLSQEKDLMEKLVDQLPHFDRYAQNWSWKITNWLPFYWRGYDQTLRYTYALPELSDLDAIWKNLQVNIRTDIRKAENRFGLRIRDDLPLEDFIRLNKLTFSRQKMALPYSEELVKRLDNACDVRFSRKIFIAEDQDGKQHAGIYIVWDKKSAYYLMGGGDPELRNSGATSLCIWEAIKFAATVTERFDFEGSMIEPVERFIRAFGAIQTPYFAVHKTQSRVLKTLNYLRDLKAK